MSLLLTIFHVLTAILTPLGTMILTLLTFIKTRKAAGGHRSTGDRVCLRCDQNRPGGEGQFQYAESVKNPRTAGIRKQIPTDTPPILGSESHFVCDRCARRYLLNEMIQQLLLVLAYPLYLYLILPLFALNGIFANFFIETLLVVLTATGGLSAYSLYRAVKLGNTPLTEARDRVAINQRRSVLGKKFSYTTQFGASQLSNKRR